MGSGNVAPAPVMLIFWAATVPPRSAAIAVAINTRFIIIVVSPGRPLARLRQDVADVDVDHVRLRERRGVRRNRERRALDVGILDHHLHAADLRIAEEDLRDADGGLEDLLVVA